MTTLTRAAAFVDDVGFALLFPTRGIELPSLFEATSDRPLDHLGADWGPDTERVWGWKDELPRRGLAWYGRFLRGRPSLLSPALLADLYERSGRPDDFVEASLEPDARRVAEIVLLSGPTSTATLREALGVEGKRGQARFSKAIGELGRSLVLTHFGTEDQGVGWPAAVLELTARAFDLGTRARRRPAARVSRSERPRARPAAADLRAAARFVDTMVQAEARDLALAFGWQPARARAALEAEMARRSNHAGARRTRAGRK